MNNFWGISVVVIFVLLLIVCFIRSYINRARNDDSNLKNDKGDDIKLVLLRAAQNDYELSMLKGLLDDNDIPYVIKDAEGGGYLRVHSGISLYPTDVLVPHSAYEKAKGLVDEAFGNN